MKDDADKVGEAPASWSTMRRSSSRWPGQSPQQAADSAQTVLAIETHAGGRIPWTAPSVATRKTVITK
jgi:hypothetical protein